MKHTVLAAAAALAAFSAFAQETKIAFVDMVVLVRNQESYDRNKKLLSDTEKDYQKRLESMRSELEEIEGEIRKLGQEHSNPMLSAAAKAKIESDAVAVQKRYVAVQQKIRSEAMRNQQDLADLEARLIKSQTDDLRKLVAKFAADKGYTAVIDKSAALFCNPDAEITVEILKVMGVDPAKAIYPDREKNESK